MGRKEVKSKDLCSDLGFELRTSHTEGHALTNCANPSSLQAMSRDKRNYQQHTPKQLKRKCEAFLGSKQDFSGCLENVG